MIDSTRSEYQNNSSFVRANSVALGTLDPREPLDDLAPLIDIVGDARVVAVGENNHHVREFGRLRHRIARLLVEQAGFTVVAVEPGFTEARSVDEWISGGPEAVEDIASDGIGFTLGEAVEVHDMLLWMRSRRAAGHPITFSGLDIPGSAGTPAAALKSVADYLEDVDPDALTFVSEAEHATQRYSGSSSAIAMSRYAELDIAARDAATAAVSRLLAHVESMRPSYLDRGGRADYELALHHLRGAWRLDQYLRELDAITRGDGAAQLNSRDTHMADTVRWLLDQHGPDSRIVTLLHNGHAQRIPCTLAPSLSMLPMGQHLATQFGDEYAAVALTCTEGTTPCVALDPDAPLGMTMWETALPPPRPGSVEALLAGSGLSLLDLRDPPPTGPSLMRHADDHIPVPAFAAFDAVIHVPTVRTTSFIDHRVESARTPPR